jgi:hypothetical protein
MYDLENLIDHASRGAHGLKRGDELILNNIWDNLLTEITNLTIGGNLDAETSKKLEKLMKSDLYLNKTNITNLGIFYSRIRAIRAYVE